METQSVILVKEKIKEGVYKGCIQTHVMKLDENNRGAKIATFSPNLRQPRKDKKTIIIGWTKYNVHSIMYN